jgi:hypothetical protein
MRPSTAQHQRRRAGLHGRASRRLAGTPTGNGRREHAAIGEPADDSERGRGPVTATATQMSKGADRRAANARTLAVAVPRTIDGATH